MRINTFSSDLGGSSRWSPVVFAGVSLIAGMLPAGIAFALNANSIRTTSSDMTSWFWIVWLVIYPCMGVATWAIWIKRHQFDVSIPLAVFGVTFLQLLTFWLSNNIVMNTVIDATGMVLAYLLAWVYGRYSRQALYWLIPLLVWMPFTTLLKVYLWSKSS